LVKEVKMAEQRTGLGVWFREEIRDALEATREAKLTTLETLRESGVETPELRAYHRGVEDAIKAVATTFGIKLKPRGKEGQVKVIEGRVLRERSG